MHFTVTKEKLQNAVVLAERVVGKKESLPVLSCVLLSANKDFSVRATNLEAGIEVHVPGDVGEKGVVAVPVSVFSQTLRAIAGDKVSLKVESENLLVESRGSKTLIKAIPHGEFPDLSSSEKGKYGVNIHRQTLLQALQAVSYAASPSMIRPELGSVFVSIKNGALITAATDSFRLAEKTFLKAADDDDKEVLIPLKHALEVSHILERIPDEQISLIADESQLVLRASGLEYVSRVVEASFPNYKEIVPKTFTTEATLLKADLIEMLRKARVFSGSEQKVGLHVYPKKKIFDATAQSAAIGEMSDSIDAALSGEDIDINFNIAYLSDCLPLIQSESVTLGFSGGGKPLVIRSASDLTFTYLVMPLNR
ncbi:MAG: DNA polymerase III subunit beta [Parcubacteria group bacterium Gr01-1014_8]|nr:MAG: DNA polymerase III subunit beta [Parcubacteria group bacterium Gr01-1014_8]